MTYTEAERRAILDALPAAARPVDETLLFSLVGTITSDLMNSRHEVLGQQERVTRAEEAIAACETLLGAIDVRRRDPMRDDTSDPADILDLFAGQLEAAREQYIQALGMERRVLVYLEEQRSEPADMIVMKAAAKVWQFLGGKVDHGKAFTQFFEAVTGPKFRTSEARRLGINAYVPTRKQRLMKVMVPTRKIRPSAGKPLKSR